MMRFLILLPALALAACGTSSLTGGVTQNPGTPAVVENT